MQHQSALCSMMKKFAVVVLVATTVGCSVMPGMRNQVDRGDVPVSGVEVVEVTPEVVLKEALATSSAIRSEELTKINTEMDAQGYRLGPGDVIRIVVWEHPELNNPSGQTQGDAASSGRLIEPDGTVFFPYVGNIKAAGLTPSELRQKIVGPLSKIIREPQVDVRVSEFRSQRVYVTGEVGSPGPLFLNDSTIGALDAIALKGGFTELSNRNEILLTRDGVTAKLGLGDASRPDARTTVGLKAGDIVYIPDISDNKIFLLGEFNSQKTILQGRTTISLAEALTQGGGFDKSGANAKAVFVFRRKAEGFGDSLGAPSTRESSSRMEVAESASLIPRVYTLDMTRAESLLLAERFPLQPRDVVYVASTDFSKYNRIISLLLPTVSTIFQLDRLTRLR